MSSHIHDRLTELLDDLVDEWHDLPPGSPDAQLPLHDYLGMTWVQYARWTETCILPYGVFLARPKRP